MKYFLTIVSFFYCTQLFGRQNISVVIAKDAPVYVQEAAKDLVWHLKKSTNKEYPIVHDTEFGSLPPKTRIIAVGKSLATKELEKEISQLEPEEFLIKTVGSKLILVANDNEEKPAVHYAVCHFLEKSIGAKWLWPGEEGTFLETKSSIETDNWDFRWKSKLEQRTMFSDVLYVRLPSEVKRWLIRHRIHNKSKYKTAHAFHGWEEKYPHLVATDPVPFRKNKDHNQIKFKINSPEFLEVVVQDFKNQPSNGIYHIAPPDGRGFEPSLLPDKDPLKVWRGDYSLTEHYLKFWSALDKKINYPKKQTDFLSNIYSSYYIFPENYTWDGRNFVFNYVCRLYPYQEETENWNRWRSTGAKLILRPNWFGKGMFTCLSNYDEQFEFFEFAKQNGMAGFYFDVLQNMWSTKGFQYYVIARMSYSDKSLYQIKEEYYEVFGDFANPIKEYQNYCNKLYNKIVGTDPQKSKEITGSKGFEGFAQHVNEKDIAAMQAILAKTNLNKLTEQQKKAALWYLSGFELSKKTFEYSKQIVKNPNDKKISVKFIQELDKLSKAYPYSFDHKRVSGAVSKYKKSGYQKEDHKNKIWQEEEQNDD